MAAKAILAGLTVAFLVDHVHSGLNEIVGGADAVPYSFPFLVPLYRDGVHVCTATITKRNEVTTAASCVLGFLGRTYSIVVAEHRPGVLEGTEKEFFVNRIFLPPSYSRITKTPDIAVLRLYRALPKMGHVRVLKSHASISLDRLAQGMNSTCVVAGWGVTVDDTGMGSNSTSEILQELETYLISDTMCDNNRSRPSVYSKEGMICAASTSGAPCDLDTGAPLLCTVSGKAYLTGIFSRYNDYTGCFAGPVTFTRVSKYKKFIRDVGDARGTPV